MKNIAVPDTKRYETYQKERENWYESLCKRCGKCCGAGGQDPCKNLLEFGDGTYKCKVYPNGPGEQETVTGKKFNCVPIREVIKYRDTLLDCAYRKS